MHDYIIFIDFDGTITAIDTLEYFMTALTGIDMREYGIQKTKEGYTVRMAITEMMGMIRSEDYKKSTYMFKDLPVREGFDDFLDAAKECNIPVVVLSGGVEEMAEETIKPYRDKIQDLWAAKVDLSGEYIRYYSGYESETELVGKTGIMARYDYDKAIAIGDSFTDREMSLASDIVFARDRLAEVLEKSGKSFYRYETFHDIAEKLRELFL